MNNKIEQQFFELYTFLNIAKKYLDTISAFENDTYMCEQKYLKMKNRKYSNLAPNIIVIFTAIFIFLVGVSLCILSLSNADTTLKTVDIYVKYPLLLTIGIVIMLISILMIIIVPVIVSSVLKRKNQIIQNEAEEFWKSIGSNTVAKNNKAIDQLRNEYEQFKNKYMYTFDFLPSQYHDMNTIAHMYSIASSGRADNLKEVINLYEEEMRWLELKNQLEYQQECMNRNMENIYNQQVKTNRILNEIEFFQICHYLDKD